MMSNQIQGRRGKLFILSRKTKSSFSPQLNILLFCVCLFVVVVGYGSFPFSKMLTEKNKTFSILRLKNIFLCLLKFGTSR